MIKISSLANLIGVSIVTLHWWEKQGKLVPAFRTLGNHRRYNKEDVLKLFKINKEEEERVEVGYVRANSHGQKKDLEAQKERIIKKVNNKNLKIISDLGSGMNFKKKGLNQLLDLIVNKKLKTIYLTHKDRLMRFGYDLFYNFCSKFGTEIIILKKDSITQGNQFVGDLIEIITVFSSKLYGSRSRKALKD